MEKLGIELPLLLTQIVNFTIMVVILSKILYKPILKALDDRKKKIEEGLRFSQEATDQKLKWESDRQKILSKAKTEAKQMLEEVKKEGKHVKEEMINEGKQELEVLKLKQEKELHNREEEITAEITSKTVDIAAEMVKRLLPELITDDIQHRFILHELERIERKHDKK